jgi:SH3-like domain-containing protein
MKLPSFRPQNRWAFVLCAAVLLLASTGCSHLRPASEQKYVYVSVKQIYLRDRVAVVANRVAEVKNGERLTVVEQEPRFLKVKTPDGAVGWVENHAVIDQSMYDQFLALARQHANQQPVARGVLFNELYMHLAPGRKTQRFYLLQPNAKVMLLERASMPREAGNGPLGLPKQPAPAAGNPQAAPKRGRDHGGKQHRESFDHQFVSAVPMEDWWLVRDPSGRTGWMLSHDLEVDVPQDVAQYAENEKMIGAYILRTVDDPDSGKPDGKVPEYLTVLTPYRQGLPYDFDQVRVFTWDTHRHRYGTAFRLRDIAGFFPVKTDPGINGENGPEPEFSILVAQGNNVSLDPVTGRAHAAQLETLTYRMEGNLVRKVLPGGTTPEKIGAPKGPAAPGRRHRSHAHARRHH